MEEVLDGRIELKHDVKTNYFRYEGILLNNPESGCKADIIISCCGGLDGYNLFRELKFTESVLNTFRDRYNRLKKPYVSINIRNTDLKCDYERLYKSNEKEIRECKELYVATDDKKRVIFQEEWCRSEELHEMCRGRICECTLFRNRWKYEISGCIM